MIVDIHYYCYCYSVDNIVFHKLFMEEDKMLTAILILNLHEWPRMKYILLIRANGGDCERTFILFN